MTLLNFTIIKSYSIAGELHGPRFTKSLINVYLYK